MRVGIDASYLLEPRKTGVETYTLNLLRALLALPERPELLLYAAGTLAEAPDAAPVLRAGDRLRLSSRRRLWLRLRMPVAMLWDRVELAHLPGTILPPWLPCPAVTTFYDLAAAHYPELYDAVELRLYERIIPTAARRSAAVIAISEATRRDLIEVLGVPSEKIFVTPLGVAGHFRPVANAAEVVAKSHGLSQPYLLASVGSGHPRKNLSGVVDAFSRLADERLTLAIIGTAARDREALSAIDSSPARDSIRLLGHVVEQDLPAIYSAAAVFCFPSFYEGFGLPVLEAMACGTPVVCSNVSSLPETAGEAALLVDPTAPGAVAEALRSVLEDEGRQRELAAAGLARAAAFTWERTARLTLRAYRAAVSS